MVTLLPVCIHITRRNGYALACVYILPGGMVTLLLVCIHLTRRNDYAVACVYTFYHEEWLRCCLCVYVLPGGMVTLLPVCIYLKRRNGYAVACLCIQLGGNIRAVILMVSLCSGI
jgi:hypothetical protein